MFIDEYMEYHRRNGTMSLINVRDKHFNCHFLSYQIIEKDIKKLSMKLRAVILTRELKDTNAWYKRYKNRGSPYLKQIEKDLKIFLKKINKSLIPPELLTLSKEKRLTTKISEKIFCIKNDGDYKVVSFFGLKIKTIKRFKNKEGQGA
jgi:hypothetical protein